MCAQSPSKNMYDAGKDVAYKESQAREVTRYRAFPNVMSRNMR